MTVYRQKQNHNKAQGSQYPIVVMPVLMNHYVMLQRNLIYTGITRAKKILVMFGTKKALSYAVRNVTVTKRNKKTERTGQLVIEAGCSFLWKSNVVGFSELLFSK
ncbi:MAG: ATP-binding domain-containing protein [Lachnospiraceae bacterium]